MTVLSGTEEPKRFEFSETELQEIKESIVRQYVRLMRHLNHSPTMQEIQDLSDDLESMFEGNIPE